MCFWKLSLLAFYKVKNTYESCYPIFFVPLQGSMKKIPRHFLILIQPHNNEWFKPAAEQETCMVKIALWFTVVNVSK